MSPSTHRSDFLAAAAERGYIHQCTDFAGLDARLAAGPLTAYVGYDCTADSLHIGNLLSIMLLRLFQKTGNKPIVLMGGGTTKIGDPSGKDEARQLLDDAAIARNMAGIRKVFARFLQFGDGPTDAVMVNNADWLDELRYIPFLRDVGRHFSVNRMLTQDSVRLRLDRDQPLSFLEFNYLDPAGLRFRRAGAARGVRIADGRLGPVGQHRRRRRTGPAQRRAHAVRADDAAPDDRVGRQDGQERAGRRLAQRRAAVALRLLAILAQHRGRRCRAFSAPLYRIAARRDRAARRLAGAEINEAKKVLATEATALAHGREAAEAAAETARARCSRARRRSAASCRKSRCRAMLLERGMPAFELFARAGLAASNSEARRLIKGGGARINDKVVSGETTPVSLADLDPQGHIKLSAGRKRHALVRPE